jgi:hypothetical protein
MANTGKYSSTSREKEDLGTTASHMATEAKHKVQETATAVSDKAKETANTLTDKAKETASNLGHKAEDAVAGVGGQMQSLAGTIRENAPHEGIMGSAASTMASGLESGGRYLKEHDFQAMTNDMAHLIRQYPIQSLLIGFGVGFLFARATRS